MAATHPISGDASGSCIEVGAFTVELPDLTLEEAAVRELVSTGYDVVEWHMIHVLEALKTEPSSFWGNNPCMLELTEVGTGLPGQSAQYQGWEG